MARGNRISAMCQTNPQPSVLCPLQPRGQVGTPEHVKGRPLGLKKSLSYRRRSRCHVCVKKYQKRQVSTFRHKGELISFVRKVGDPCRPRFLSPSNFINDEWQISGHTPQAKGRNPDDRDHNQNAKVHSRPEVDNHWRPCCMHWLAPLLLLLCCRCVAAVLLLGCCCAAAVPLLCCCCAAVVPLLSCCGPSVELLLSCCCCAVVVLLSCCSAAVPVF